MLAGRIWSMQLLGRTAAAQALITTWRRTADGHAIPFRPSATYAACGERREEDTAHAAVSFATETQVVAIVFLIIFF